MPYEPTGISVDVVLSGQHSTTVKPLAGGDTAITFSTTSSDVYPASGVEICAHLPGMQGPAGVDIGAIGKQGSIQYNEGGILTGANNFFYDKSSDKVSISGGSLVINNGQFILSGNSTLDENGASFLIKDESSTLINIDPQTKNITFSEGTANNEYYIGVGHSEPEEKLHIKNGNLRVDGDIILSGNLLPTEGSEFDLGSQAAPFKDLYLAGDSIVFPSQQTKLKVSENSITFQKDIYTSPVDLFKVEKLGDATLISGITIVDSVIKEDITGPEVVYGGFESTYAHSSGGAFASKNIPDGATNVFMYFGQDLGYVPKVVCTLIAPPNSHEMYFYMIENIKTSGCDVFFSSAIDSEGYEVQCLATPKTGEGYFNS